MSSQPAAARAAATHLLPGLPDEVVVWEILVRLPPKALLRCRAVRRAWRLATSTRDFLLAHHARQPTAPLLHGYNCAGDVVDSLDIIPLDNVAGADAADQLQYSARPGIRSVYGHGLVLHDSCDGLLLLSLYSTHSVYNPATRQYAPLQQLNGFMPLGMYRHGPTGEYRLLLHPFRRSVAPDAQDGAHVFSLGSGQLPRYIGCSDTQELIHISAGSVLFHGSLHWYMNRIVMVFDTIAESFRSMRCPIVIGCEDLFEMGDMLGMFSLNYEGTSVEIWAMQDYEAEIWALKYRVEFPVAEISLQCGKFDHHWEVIVTSWDSDVLVLLRFDDWLLQVGMEGQLVASFHRKGLRPTRLRLKQSLVSHAFFPTLEGYVVNGSPFIR
ncbi:F-box/LRR-repeat protein At2g43260 [Triticum aestivum]|nr:F-box/LRR-repeat protein At2g43260-like [Triticum aestivum]